MIAFSVSKAVRCTSVVDLSLTTLSCTLSYLALNASMYAFVLSAEEIKSSVLVLVMVRLIDNSPLK